MGGRGSLSAVVAPATGPYRPAMHAQHDVAPTKSLNFPAGHAAQLLPSALPKHEPSVEIVRPTPNERKFGTSRLGSASSSTESAKPLLAEVG